MATSGWFDADAFHRALDATRQARRLTWRVETGMPILRDACQLDEHPEDSHLEKQFTAVMPLVPA